MFIKWFIGLDLLYLLNGLLNGLLCVIVEECSHTGLRGMGPRPIPGLIQYSCTARALIGLMNPRLCDVTEWPRLISRVFSEAQAQSGQ